MFTRLSEKIQLFRMALIITAMFLFTFLSGCGASSSAHVVPAPLADGDVVALGVNATYQGVRAVIQGTALHAKLMSDGENFIVLMWPLKQCRWATLFFDLKNMQFVRSAADVKARLDQAGLMSARTASDFVSWLKAEGFSELDPKALPGIFAAAEQAALNKALITAPVFIMLPVGATYTDGEVYNALMPQPIQQ